MITVDFKRVQVEPGARILDIGCGPGRHTCEAYRLKDAVVVGADRNFSDLEEARNRLCYHDALAEHGGGVWCLSSADIRQLPFKNESFDLVICSEVLEHIPDDRAAMREIIRVLKPRKPLVVSVPRYLPERICWALSDDYFNANQGHVRIYDKRELIQRLEAGGVRHFETHYAHSLHSPYWWLKCLVGPGRKDSWPVNLYHRFLTWDIMQKPFLTRFLDRLFNPILGKSLVLYFLKQ
ncbi:MAG: methyltransferase domain-containing protein [Thermodesulfobacteriota bacterium]